MAHATLVNVDVETAPKLAAFIANAVGGEDGNVYLSECHTLINNAQTCELLRKFLSKSENILRIDNDKEAEGCFQAIVSILYTIEEQSEIQSIIDLTIETLCSSKSEKCELRLRTLVSFFNLLISVPAKLCVLTALFNYAKDTNQTDLVKHFSDSVSRWADEWELSLQDKRGLLWVVSTVLQNDSNSLKFLIKYLNTFENEEYSTQAADAATAAVVSAIRSPLTSFSDRSVLYQAVSKHNVNNAELQGLITLLRIICEGDIAQYIAYEKSNGALMAKHAIANEAVMHSLRLLKLCNLATRVDTARSGELSYDAIAAGLEVNVDDVEIWVVDAISNGLMTATIDQVKRIVVVSQCVRATFGIDQWKDLSQKLSVWKSGLGNLLQAVEKHNSKELA